MIYDNVLLNSHAVAYVRRTQSCLPEFHELIRIDIKARILTFNS